MSRKQRNFRKSRALQEQEQLSEEEEGEPLEELKLLQQQRKRQKGLGADVLVTGGSAPGAGMGEVSESDDEDDGADLNTGYVKEKARVDEEEDPHMTKYVEEQLAKRMGKQTATDAELLRDARAPPQDSGFIEVPESLRAPKASDLEIAGTWVTGITEVALPVQFRLQNIEETEEAKKQLLERRGQRQGESSGRLTPESLHRTMLPMNFGRKQLILTQKDDSFVGHQMRQDWKEKKKKKRG